MTQSSSTSPDVVVVGGGPVGMWMAAALGKHGVRTLVIERADAGSDQAKVMQISVRTVEFARQLGFSEEMYTWGFPRDFPMNNVFVTDLAGYELGRTTGSPVGEPGAPGYTEFSPTFQVHCPQPWLEPIVERATRSFPSVDVRRGWEFESFTEDDAGVTVTVRDIESGAVETIRTQYVVACEGFGGKAISQLGVPVEERTVDYSVDIEFQSEQLLQEHDKGPAHRYTLIGPEGTWATLVAVDGLGRYRLSVYGVDRDKADSLDADEAIVRTLGRAFDYTFLRKGRWKRRLAVAATFSRGRVFLAGDSAHCSPPNGGLGMNTGIADAMNLAWKLSAAIDGWAGSDLLESYTEERRPLALMTLAESMKDYKRLVENSAYAGILDATHEADAQRRVIGRRMADESLKAWRPLGVHLGYGYPWSSVVATPPGTYPEFDMQHYAPSTAPGFRAPHAWIAEGLSVLDLFGGAHVLLRIGTSGDSGERLLAAAQDAGMPVVVHDIDDPAVEAVYDRRLVLVRPDGHIAWSDDTDPKDPGRVIDTVRGALGATVHELSEAAQ